MSHTRAPAVAGTFYPEQPERLRGMVEGFLTAVDKKGPAPKALIAPHAGYVYSGAIAASAYARLAPVHDIVERVVVLGPSHRVAFRGMALSTADRFRTPLGDIPLDSSAAAQLSDLPFVGLLDDAHLMEHSLEVQLPFLQLTLDSFRLIPLVVGDASADEAAQVLERLWGGDETLIVISSDLSHYHDYATARAMDRETSDLIQSLGSTRIDGEHACGCRPINGLMVAARRRGLKGEILDLRNSGDTAGPRDRVVGYGAYGFR